jgi:GT2 family glycosyltransferase
MLSVDEAPMLAYSLPAARLQADADVVVIDNACTDGTADLALGQGARVVRLPERVSYAAAMNAGLAEVETPAVLLLNADCFLEPDFLATAIPHLQRGGVGSVAGKLLRTDGAVGDPPAEVDAAGMFVNRRRRNGLVGHGAPATTYARGGDCFGADGACALYRRETLDACALPEVFDTDMGLWATDADLAWRARLLGWRCVYEPAARARHIRTYSPSKRSGVSKEHRSLQFRNRYLMWCKNETWPGLARHLPLILAWELLAFGYVVLRERHLLRAYAEVARALPAARRRRREVQAAGRVLPPFGLHPPR